VFEGREYPSTIPTVDMASGWSRLGNRSRTRALRSARHGSIVSPPTGWRWTCPVSPRSAGLANVPRCRDKSMHAPSRRPAANVANSNNPNRFVTSRDVPTVGLAGRGPPQRLHHARQGGVSADELDPDTPSRMQGSHYDRSCWIVTVPRVREPVLDRRVKVAQLWRLASDAARTGEKWGQRKKSVSDAMAGCSCPRRCNGRCR
jgi:hypothetical protein